MAINKFTVNLSFTEVERVVVKLRKLRDDSGYVLHSELDGYVLSRNYNSDTKEYEPVEKPHVERWRVTSAENYVKDYAELSEIISWFTGEHETLDADKLAVLMAARQRLDDETEAAKAEAEVN